MKHLMLSAQLLLLLLLLLLATSTRGDQCGDESPTLTEGGSLHEASAETVLSPSDRAVIARMLEQFDGDWEGTGIGVLCLGEGDTARERVTRYEIEAEGQGSKTRGELQLELGHERGTVNERLRLLLKGDHLQLRDNVGGLEILSVSSGMVEYLHRYRTNKGRTPMEARWRVVVSGRGINARLTAEHWIYAPGGLGSYGRWALTRR